MSQITNDNYKELFTSLDGDLDTEFDDSSDSDTSDYDLEELVSRKVGARSNPLPKSNAPVAIPQKEEEVRVNANSPDTGSGLSTYFSFPCPVAQDLKEATNTPLGNMGALTKSPAKMEDMDTRSDFGPALSAAFKVEGSDTSVDDSSISHQSSSSQSPLFWPDSDFKTLCEDHKNSEMFANPGWGTAEIERGWTPETDHMMDLTGRGK
jgi:hypothetical protein